MWDMQTSCQHSAREQLEANRRTETQDAIVSAIPALYYRDVTSQHIVDKCRSWTLPANMDMLRRYVTNKPKVIVLTRPVDEIVKSFVALRKRNGWRGEGIADDLLRPGSEPLMRSLEGVEHARNSGSDEFLFLTYADLVDRPDSTIDKIYEFCEWEPFTHDFDNIVNLHPEDDSVYGFVGMHDVRPTLGRREEFDATHPRGEQGRAR